jgi:cytochrome b involved in lipid metabolism
MVIDDKVYDVSKFLAIHPGGSVVLRQVAGQDVTELFFGFFRHAFLHFLV